VPRTSLDAIHSFLAVRSIAIAGVSRNPKDYSRIVHAELEQRGYEVSAVNPNIDAIGDAKCFAAVDQIDPPPQAAILLVPDSQVLETTRAAIRAGVLHLWFRHGETSSPAYRQAVAEARAIGLTVITGECPLMFLPNGAWIHRAHATLRQWTGSYPC